jgi:fido (protein-threonine AMPylation protein)
MPAILKRLSLDYVKISIAHPFMGGNQHKEEGK